MKEGAEKIMKRCQAGTRNYEEANNLHAACYRVIGKLLARPEQEPVARVVEHGATVKLEWASADAAHNAKVGNLYTTPPQRTWVGLTDDEFEDIELGCRSTPFGKIEAMRMVEAKLKDKNT